MDITLHDFDDDALKRLEDRARRSGRTLDHEVRDALFLAVASFGSKQDLSAHDLHALTRKIGRVTVEVR